jgi:DNA polymerase III delta subunit
MVTLLKALASGDLSGAKTDLAKLKTDLTAQQASTSNSSSTLTQDVTSFLKDLTSGNTTDAKSDLAKIKTDLQDQDAADLTGGSSSTQNSNPLDTLISKLSDSLSSGSVQGALQDLASYLVQIGQGTGSLVNTTA